MHKHASLCLLAYKRPDRLRDCIETLKQTADYPYTLIVNLDGNDSGNLEYLTELLNRQEISYLVANGGNNRGVGRSFQNCLGLAEGHYIFKIDTDLTFKPRWLSTAIKVLDSNRDIGAVSLFDYHHYDPNDDRFKPFNNLVETRTDCFVVKDFVSSVYGFRTVDWVGRHILTGEPVVPDDGLHQDFGKMAITLEDYVENHGFGVYKSTYVSGTEDAPYKTPTHEEPLIFLKGHSE